MNSTVQVEQITPGRIKLTPQGATGDGVLAQKLLIAFLQAEKQGARWFSLDLVNVLNLSADFVVLLLELTARAKRRGGELSVKNLNTSVVEDLLTFTAKEYLKIDAQATEPSMVAQPAHQQRRTSSVEDAALQAEGWSRRVSRVELPYDEDSIYMATELAAREAEELGFASNEISRIKIATYEACLNAIQHTRTARAQSKIIVEVEKMMNALQIRVIDFGRGFEVQKTRAFDITEAAMKGRTGGMGLHIIRRAMDIVDYQIDQLNGNQLKMIKYLRKGQ